MNPEEMAHAVTKAIEVACAPLLHRIIELENHNAKAMIPLTVKGARSSEDATQQLADVIALAVHTATDPLLATITAQDARIKALEERRGLVFRGAWDANETYEVGDGVQHQNSTWGRVCVTSRHAKPGESRDWILSAKCGRDGRDLR